MASRRMFSKDFMLNDTFIELAHSTKILYFYLMSNADDDGFFDNVKTIIRLCGATENDLKILIDNGFVIKFDSGAYVITHWKMHNYIQGDRYHQTNYQNEFAQLSVNQHKKYMLMDTDCIQVVSAGKVSIGKDSVVENSLIQNSKGEIRQVVGKESLREKPTDKNGNELNDLENNEFRAFFNAKK